MIPLSPNLPQFRRSGRWSQTDSGSLVASWASASISFILSSSTLSISLGPQTERLYSDTSTTLVCSLVHTDQSTQILTFSHTEPGVLHLFDRLKDGQQKLVEITLVLWSSVIELVSINVDAVDSVQARPDPSQSSRLLFIGDSISCGFSSPPALIPRGSLDAFTSLASAHLGLPYDIVAYPGITLVERIRAKDGMASRFFLAGSSPFEDTPAQLDERPTIIVIALGTNDRGVGVEPSLFVQTMRAFVARLADVYRETLAHICILHPFPYFGTVTLPEFADAFIEIADQVTADHPTLGVHVWNLRGTLNRSLTIDRLHPTVHGHIALGEALAMRLRWLVTGP
ncbi:SGNH hydrolase-type esterase domain-containing protein [Russula dissimulans]|nr:SGNH hydrolase-type esterase domain-containing protein [Russula dissimulans]